MSWRTEDERKLLMEFLAWLKEQDPLEDEDVLVDWFLKSRTVT